MLNETTPATVCTHPTDRVHTPTHTPNNTQPAMQTIYYWTDDDLYWLPEGEEARRIERFEIYGTTYKAELPSDWSNKQITAHLQTVCTQSPEVCAHTQAHPQSTH